MIVEDRFAPHLRWNVALLGLDMALFVGGISFSAWTTILPLYVRHLSGSNLVLGLMPAIRNLGIYLPPIFVSAYVERLLLYKPYVLLWTIWERLPYLLLAGATVWLWPQHPTLLLLTFFVLLGTSTVAGGVCTPAWLQMVSLMIPMRLRGRFFGMASGVGGLLAVAGAAMTAALLRHYPFPTNFALCFLATFAFLCASFVALALGREPANPGATRRPPPRPFWSYLRTLPPLLRRERNFAVFLLASIFANLGMAISPFLAVAASRNLHVSDAQVGIYSGVLVATATLGSVGWGWLGDHAGYRLVLLAGTLAGLLSLSLAVVALGASSAGLFFGVFAALGAYSSAIQLASFTVVTEFGTEGERPTYIALSSLALAPVALIAPILGGALADRLGYAAIFLGTCVALLCACALFAFAVRDPRAAHVAG